MSFLVIIMLAAGLPAIPATTVMHAGQTESALHRMATIEAPVHYQTLQKALASSSRAFSQSLQRQLASIRLRPNQAPAQATTLAHQAKVTLDRQVAQDKHRLRHHAISAALETITFKIQALLEARHAIQDVETIAGHLSTALSWMGAK